jgi:hypothetical protein
MSDHSTEQAFLKTVSPDAKLRWSGTPNVGATLMAELGCLGVPIIAFIILGLVVAAAEGIVAGTASAHPFPRGDLPPLWLIGLFGSFVLSSFVLPGALMEWLSLRNTRYYVTTKNVIIVDGVLGRRVRRFVVPESLDLTTSPARGGTIEFGSIEHEELALPSLALVRKETLPLRFRGVGERAGEVVAALKTSREEV